MTPEAGEIMEKLKDKKVEYEAIASSDSSVHLEGIDNRIITEVLGPERYGRVRFQGSFVSPTQYFGSSSQQYMALGSQAQAEVQRLKDQMTQMQATTAEVQRKYEELQLQLKADAAAREVEVQKKYEELQLRLKADAASREAEQSRKYDELQQQLQSLMMFQSQLPSSQCIA
ncbi:uncharacterized protein LOC128033966 [Gossypium raimondii]|uniref:uncharacterized protein LOC128033966 n=1 Tax=Gossypium raimondii TaxID=29730 RepID=UPI00227C4707|nr:uncharacterized protein LOC128033966 [Gossypium raimondii]